MFSTSSVIATARTPSENPSSRFVFTSGDSAPSGRLPARAPGAYRQPSPSDGPPLLSGSASPPPPCGMQPGFLVVVVGGGVVEVLGVVLVVVGGGAGVVVTRCG